MWFKNVRAYRLTYDAGVNADTLEAALQTRTFVPCGKTDTLRAGWVSPLGDNGQMLTHTVGQHAMICLRLQEKVLPPAAINERVDERVAEVEAREGRPVRRKEKTALKEETILDLLPRALTKSELLYAYFDFERRWLLIDTASESKAERLIDYLRAILEALPVVPLEPQQDVISTMTAWLVGGAPKHLALDQDIELTNKEHVRNTVRCRNQDIDSAEVRSHLDAGKQVTLLGVQWREAIDLLLDHQFIIRRLRFDDKIRVHEEGAGDDAASRFDQDFAVMAVQLGSLIDDLLEACGGVETI
ncbi:MAG: recombination-associated protein RdgC [Pseudomonadota bacterium]